MPFHVGANLIGKLCHCRNEEPISRSLKGHSFGATCCYKYLTMFVSLTIVSYLAANIGYFAVLPMSIIASSETIALVLPLTMVNNCRISDPRCLVQQAASFSP